MASAESNGWLDPALHFVHLPLPKQQALNKVNDSKQYQKAKSHYPSPPSKMPRELQVKQNFSGQMYNSSYVALVRAGGKKAGRGGGGGVRVVLISQHIINAY